MKKVKRISLEEVREIRLSKKEKKYILIEKKCFKNNDSIKICLTFQTKDYIGIYKLDSTIELISCYIGYIDAVNKFKNHHEILEGKELNYCDIVNLYDFPYIMSGSASKTDFDFDEDEKLSTQDWINEFKKYILADMK